MHVHVILHVILHVCACNIYAKYMWRFIYVHICTHSLTLYIGRQMDRVIRSHLWLQDWGPQNPLPVCDWKKNENRTNHVMNLFPPNISLVIVSYIASLTSTGQESVIISQVAVTKYKTKYRLIISLRRDCCHFSVSESVQLSASLWTEARQAPLSFTVSQSLPTFMSIESVMLPNHLIFCHPLLLLPLIFPRSRANILKGM